MRSGLRSFDLGGGGGFVERNGARGGTGRGTGGGHGTFLTMLVWRVNG